jgi:hypothetical protein
MDCYIDDPTGNGNNRIDPGENFNLMVSLQNIGSLPMEGGQAFLNIDPEFLTISNPELDIENLDYGESTQLSFNMNCSWTCPIEELLMTVLNITSNEGFFQQSFPLNFSPGAIIEDWETVNFNKFDWTNGGNKLWAMSFLDPFQGACSAKSGNIDNGEESYLQVTMDVIGYDDVSFYRKVSSESGSDFLRFYIDNNLAGEWSGTLSWEQVSFQVSPGFHTFKWAFEKDNLNSIGSDCGWLDYIVFPSCNLDGTLKALANAIPHEFCGQGETQLGAYVLGGSGNSLFQWQPALLLDDPASQFPAASLDTITLFSVEVINGADTTGSIVQVNSYSVPSIPVIYQQGDSLISSVETGNQWYDNSGMVPGATGQVFYPQVESDYFVIITNEYGCISDTSNIINFIFTSVTENITDNTITIYPNPFNDVINIHFATKPMQEMTVKIIDITGHEIIEKHIEPDESQEDILMPTPALKNCLYLFNIFDHEGRLLVSKKIMKF